ncbi:MAG: M67 family metallopeptidase [Euryarchaeota archaeon]|nr:M67 family metallopeptidase [Euryarchaeota archaeon]
MRIARECLEEVLGHAREEYPRECCGLLGGRGEITRVYRGRNLAGGEAEYHLDPGEQIRLFNLLEREGLDLLGIYHSHPRWPARPSAVDIERAFYPIPYLIVSLLDPRRPEVRAWRIEGGEVREEGVEGF